MIERPFWNERLAAAWKQASIVWLTGPRRVGKTVLGQSLPDAEFLNCDLPSVAEMYVHRIGRTGRAGAVGQAVSFCSPDQRGELSDIERLLGHRIPALSHSIKSASPDRCNGTAAPGSAGRRQTGGSPRQGYGPARRDRGGHAPPRAASPERQKADFWSRRRNPRRPASARPGQSNRRSG